MNPPGSITLGQITSPMLNVSCNRCPRRGLLSVDRLLATHGPDFLVPALRHVIAADCAHMIEGKIADPCGVHFPGLAVS